jgi:hypothetical protein
MKPLVYVAGPYASHPTHNTWAAVVAGLGLWRTGRVAVLIPHTSLVADLVVPMLEADWYAFDLDQLAHCDAVLRLPGESRGADAEVAFAEEHGLPVFGDVEALLRWVDDPQGLAEDVERRAS